MTRKNSVLLLLPALLAANSTFAQQVNVARIELMPNVPSPLVMRDWQAVAVGYDQFVFDLSKSGTYLPLVWKYSSTINYPAHGSFGLDTVVGTPREDASEAINVLPALVGASLVGIDKSDQDGENWVLMAEEYFNRRPEENVYLNRPVTETGDDWWYETMPNVFFYQLSSLYPGTGDFDYQFTTVANQWLESVSRMGGSASPWRKPNMNYRAWSLSTMKGLLSGVKEPEAAGAIGWILYNAYVETGDDRYRLGAEWAMEYLSGLTSNPSYELQLPYGAYAAARMNAELGSNYDVSKIVNWTFDVGPLRSWGSLIGTWGGLDADGLIGEESSNDYAFLMNGFQQAGALVPMVRYDDRFARAIGKWVLNLANASRLFYSNYLPAINQDSEEWSYVYDPESVIGHEALRQSQSGQSPYATGDAIGGGWGFTNLALYGSSHVGYLGGLVDTTDVEGVLQLDVLKTDFFGAAAYPTHLYFNPYLSDTTVTIELGASTVDLYDLVSNQFVASSVSGSTSIELPGDQAMLLARVPVGGVASYDLGRLLIDGVTVDFRSDQQPANYPPRIKGLDSGSSDIFRQDSTMVYCSAEDRDDASLSFAWSVTGGEIVGDGSAVTWKAPTEAGLFDVACEVNDGRGGVAADTLYLTVFSNNRPVIESLSADPPVVFPKESTTLACDATDADGDALTYAWAASEGAISGTGSSVLWTAPDDVGYYVVQCTVSDPDGAEAEDSIGVAVGDLVADLRFTGDNSDHSGFDNGVVVTGEPAFVADRDGNPAAAYELDGVDDALQVRNNGSLNFSDAITVSFWMKPSATPNRESFPISHGSWQNRWKVSITPDRKVRWTINTDVAITDLDAAGLVATDSLYHVAATYGDGAMKVFVNGMIGGEAAAAGTLSQTTLDLTIGQMVPGDVQYNFAGVIDDVRIYNRALSGDEIVGLFTHPTGVDDASGDALASGMFANYPNPFSESTTIPYELARAGHVSISVFDLAGRRVGSLLEEDLSSGAHTLNWDGMDGAGRALPSGVYLIRFESADRVQYRKLTRIKNQR